MERNGFAWDAVTIPTIWPRTARSPSHVTWTDASTNIMHGYIITARKSECQTKLKLAKKKLKKPKQHKSSQKEAKLCERKKSNEEEVRTNMHLLQKTKIYFQMLSVTINANGKTLDSLTSYCEPTNQSTLNQKLRMKRRSTFNE